LVVIEDVPVLISEMQLEVCVRYILLGGSDSIDFFLREIQGLVPEDCANRGRLEGRTSLVLLVCAQDVGGDVGYGLPYSSLPILRGGRTCRRSHDVYRDLAQVVAAGKELLET